MQYHAAEAGQEFTRLAFHAHTMPRMGCVGRNAEIGFISNPCMVPGSSTAGYTHSFPPQLHLPGSVTHASLLPIRLLNHRNPPKQYDVICSEGQRVRLRVCVIVDDTSIVYVLQALDGHPMSSGERIAQLVVLSCSKSGSKVCGRGSRGSCLSAISL